MSEILTTQAYVILDLTRFFIPCSEPSICFADLEIIQIY